MAIVICGCAASGNGADSECPCCGGQGYHTADVPSAQTVTESFRPERKATPDIRTKYKYIRFDKLDSNGKTSKWICIANKGGFLGDVYWYGAWRQYIFAPDCAIFSIGCLQDIADFLGTLNTLQRSN